MAGGNIIRKLFGKGIDALTDSDFGALKNLQGDASVMLGERETPLPLSDFLKMLPENFELTVKNVAQEIIDAKLAREQLNEIRNLVNLRFGPNTWQEILAERKRRIDAKKEAIREAKRKKAQQMRDIQDLFTYACYGLAVIGMLGAIGYVVYVVLTS